MLFYVNKAITSDLTERGIDIVRRVPDVYVAYELPVSNPMRIEEGVACYVSSSDKTMVVHGNRWQVLCDGNWWDDAEVS